MKIRPAIPVGLAPRIGALGSVRASTHLAAMDETIRTLGLIDDDDILLDMAGVQLAALDHPGVDPAPYVDVLTAIAQRVADLGGAASESSAQVEILAHVIGDAFGFTGDRATYDDPANADMIRVIDRRRGLPVSLSLLYVAAARRMGWTANALNTPGHLLVRIGAGASPLLIDPFAGGTVVAADRLEALLAPVLAEGQRLDSRHLAAMSNRAVLVRLLMNQATRADAAGDARRALTLYERMTDIAPDTGHAWWERARLELVHGEVPAARRSLGAMLEVTRDPERRGRIGAALASLAGSEP